MQLLAWLAVILVSCLACLIQEVFNGRGAVHSPLGDLSSCKAPAVYTNFFLRVSCFLETKKPQIPTVSKEMGKEEKARDRVQLHLPAAAKLYARVGRSGSLSSLNSYRAKEEEQRLQRQHWRLGHLNLLERSGGCVPECCWAA